MESVTGVTEANDGELRESESAPVHRFVRQIELQGIVTVRERHEAQISEWPSGFYAKLGDRMLGSVRFDGRYEDGRNWVLNEGHAPSHLMPRFETKEEASQAFFSRFGLECPSGGPFDVGQEAE